MPEAAALNTNSNDVLKDLLVEWIFFMVILGTEADSEFSQFLEVLLDPLDNEVAATLLQGDEHTIRMPLGFLFTPLPDVLLDILTTR